MSANKLPHLHVCCHQTTSKSHCAYMTLHSSVIELFLQSVLNLTIGVHINVLVGLISMLSTPTKMCRESQGKSNYSDVYTLNRSSTRRRMCACSTRSALVVRPRNKYIQYYKLLLAYGGLVCILKSTCQRRIGRILSAKQVKRTLRIAVRISILIFLSFKMPICHPILSQYSTQ